MADAVESKELVDIEKKTAITAFNDTVAFEKMIADIKAAVTASIENRGDLDMAKKADRDFVRSLAAKIPKVKTRIDAWGAAEVEEKRKEVAKIDALRKTFKDTLDELRDSTRQPLTDWEEAEETRKGAIQARIEAARELGKVAFGESSEQIQARIDRLPTEPLSSYDEFEDEAKNVIEDAYNNLVNAKQVAKATEDAAAEQLRMRQEHEALLAKNADADRIQKCRDVIAQIKLIGAGQHPSLEEPTGVELVRALNAIRITPDFGDLFDEASDAKDTALEKINVRVAKEAADKAKADADAAAEQQRQNELQVERERAAAAEQALADREEADRRKAAEEEAARANPAPASPSPVSSEAVREAHSDVDMEEAMMKARDDILSIIMGSSKRSEAALAIVHAIIKGEVHHVVFGA